jgi:GAF domain-containing protein
VVTDDQAHLAAELRAAIDVSTAANIIGGPVELSPLLHMIVKTAADVLGARVGSLLLVDEARQELIFEVSTADDVRELKNIRVPLGQGIAGLVAFTGQPMAVQDAQSDPRHAAEIAQRTGYHPSSLLCVPLPYNDTVIGVIELLDKQGADGFDATDMHALSLFATQAAVAIEQSRAERGLAALLRELLGSLGDGQAKERSTLVERVSALTAELQLEPGFARVVELAELVRDVASAGEAEANLCVTVLRDVAEYARARRQPTRPPASPRH